MKYGKNASLPSGGARLTIIVDKIDCNLQQPNKILINGSAHKIHFLFEQRKVKNHEAHSESSRQFLLVDGDLTSRVIVGHEILPFLSGC
jgi:hypothetical protein